MEDAHSTILDLESHAAPQSDPNKRMSFFGVFDGHGGEKVALFAGENVHRIVSNQEAFKKGDLELALKNGFLATDRAILEDPKYEEEVSGCTASCAIVRRDKVIVANAGDSRTVLGVKGRAKPLSFDHKPQNEGEKARICAAGGFVDYGRVNGNLALSRALGDFEFKKSADLAPEQQIVTAYPDVTTHQISEDDEFLVLACDGIWDCQSSQGVIEFVRRGIAAKQELHHICENLMDNCLASNCETGGVGCDNMTMMIVGLLNGKTKEQWYSMIADRVAKGDGPCAPPEYAEFRGPGIHHSLDDTVDEYDPDLSSSGITRGLAGFARSGRIILLGDGTEVLTDMNEEEMFNNTDSQRSGQNPRVEEVSNDSVDPHSTDDVGGASNKEEESDEKIANGEKVPSAGEVKGDEKTSAAPAPASASASAAPAEEDCSKSAETKSAAEQKTQTIEYASSKEPAAASFASSGSEKVKGST
ncbi:Protein phosphatase 2C 2 [Ascosphaera aggregata]|nr:Protein phosphatase 2C 2 [Ascosphaera aggregata]